MEELDYAKDSTINVNALDVEWANHANMERKYIEQVSFYKKKVIRATEKYKLAHEKLKTSRSKLISKCQNNPQKYIGKDKATGPEVEAFYRTHHVYLSNKRKLIKKEMRMMEAEEEHMTARDMKDLMHFTRTKALEELKSLMEQEYFSGPKDPRNINKEIRKKEKAEQRSKKIGQGMKRNSK